MKINWKVRIKNPVFWTTLIPAFVGFLYFVLGLFGVVPAVSESMAVDALLAIVSALTIFGVLVDPTTHGLSDSERAMTYNEPYKDENSINDPTKEAE